jgi:hypothetical protein
MARTIRARFDGRVIVPEEPVDLPPDQELEVELRPIPAPPDAATIADRLQRLAAASGRIVGPVLSDEALRRENLYEDRS